MMSNNFSEPWFWLTVVLLCGSAAQHAHALDNGFTLPALGWSSWYAAPDGSQVTDAFVRASAEALVSSGLAKKGYKYVNVDEGWLKGRSPNGTIFEDLEKFPHGMKGLGDWVTSQPVAAGSTEKLVYGLYSCRGTCQCGTGKYGAVGSNGHEAEDTQWMIDAGARWLKIDSCCGSPTHSVAYSDYGKFRDAMNKSGEHVWFNLCGWNEWYAPPDPSLNYGGGQTLGNSYRISGDGGSWGAITEALNVMARVTQYNHPGGYADPDNILGPHGTVGRVSESQARVQMVLWSVMPTQLIIGEDVTQMSDEYIATVGNEELIAVNQDAPLVGSATRIIGGDLKFPCYGDGLSAPINWTKTNQPVAIPSTLWMLEGGAAETGSKLHGQTDIRSGSPGTTSMAVVEQPLASLGHAITAVNISFSYISGYGCDDTGGQCSGASNVSLAIVDAVDHTQVVATVWTSPALNNASYDKYAGYSAVTGSSAAGLSASWPRETQLALVLHNNKRNLQIPIASVKLSISWGHGAPSAWHPLPKVKNPNGVCENIWSRPLSNGDVALAMVNQGANASIVCNATCFGLAGLGGAKKLKVRDMIAHADLPELSPPFALTALVAGQGAAAAFRITPVK